MDFILCFNQNCLFFTVYFNKIRMSYQLASGETFSAYGQHMITEYELIREILWYVIFSVLSQLVISEI